MSVMTTWQITDCWSLNIKHLRMLLYFFVCYYISWIARRNFKILSQQKLKKSLYCPHIFIKPFRKTVRQSEIRRYKGIFRGLIIIFLIFLGVWKTFISQLDHGVFCVYRFKGSIVIRMLPRFSDHIIAPPEGPALTVVQVTVLSYRRVSLRPKRFSLSAGNENTIASTHR